MLRNYYKISLILISIQLCTLQIIVAQDTILVVGNAEKSDSIFIKTQQRIRGRNMTSIDATNDTTSVQTNSIIKRKGDPMKATMMSAVFPGGGQIYNRKYWKIPIVYIGFGALFYAIKSNSDNYQMYYKGYVDFTDDIKETNSYLKFIPFEPSTYDPILYPESHSSSLAKTVEDRMFRLIDYHKRYRDLSIILTGVWYFIQILDANVDASLMGYDVSDNLELSLSPKMFNAPGVNPFTGVNLRFTIAF